MEKTSDETRVEAPLPQTNNTDCSDAPSTQTSMSSTRPAPWGAETDLIDRVRDGDASAMAVLYERHRGQALRFARSLMSGPQDAEDIVHEAFARAVGAIRNGSGPTYAFGPYLSACVRSVANSLWKKQSRERPAPFEDLDPGPTEDLGLERVGKGTSATPRRASISLAGVKFGVCFRSWAGQWRGKGTDRVTIPGLRR